MLELLQPTAGNLVSIGASGTVTAEDYEMEWINGQPAVVLGQMS